jgi:hypothetical protein
LQDGTPEALNAASRSAERRIEMVAVVCGQASSQEKLMNEAVMAIGTAVDTRRWFYVWMAGACALVAFGGFAPTYWLQLPPGTFVGSPLLHLHSLLFSAWTLLLLVQTSFVALGRIQRHRSWGMLGIALATAMVFVGVAVADEALTRRLAEGFGDRARAFHIASISMIVLFSGFFCAAIVYLRQPEVHKRLMLLATVSLLSPAIARLFYAVNVGMSAGLRPGLGPPRTVDSVLVPALLADALIVVAMIFDWRTRGRIHPAYLVGGAIMVGVHVLRAPASTTSWWYAIADFLARFSG